MTPPWLSYKREILYLVGTLHRAWYQPQIMPYIVSNFKIGPDQIDQIVDERKRTISKLGLVKFVR